MVGSDEFGWLEGHHERRGQMGFIRAEEQNGRRYIAARVDFPSASGWWPRTTEACSYDEARQWVDEQIADYREHFPQGAGTDNSRQQGEE